MDAYALAAVFAQYGLTGLASWVQDMIVEHGDQAGYKISAEIYDRPEYQAAFPAMAALREKGMTISEAEYKATEQTYRDALSFYGLAGSAYDTQDTYTKLIESMVSPRELEARLDDARAVAMATDENVRRALTDYYGINANDLMVYALDPKGVGKDHVERLARSAVVAGVAATTQLQLDRQYVESLAMDSALDNSTEADVRTALNEAAQVKATQQRLAAIEGERYSDQEAVDIAVKNDAAKILKSRQRAQREVARFASSSGLSTQSLQSQGI